jgi:dipeptidyl aminopeptidase/acylaminoacyl peptidase
MPKIIARFGLFIAILVSAHTQVPPVPLIPLKVLLSPPTVQAVEISPDGKMISFIAPLDGVANLFVAPANAPASRRAITRYQARGLQVYDVSGNVIYRWTADSTRIVYLQDHDGDESWNIYRVDVASGESKNLKPIPHAQVRMVATSPKHPREALIGINDRDPKWHDVYSLNLSTGERRLVYKNDRFVYYIADNELRLRLGMEVADDGGARYYKSADGGNWQLFATLSMEDLSMSKSFGFDQTNTVLYAYDSRGRNTAALVGLNLKTGARDVLAEDDKVDIGGVLFDPGTRKLQAYAANFTRTEWHAVDKMIAGDLKTLSSIAAGDWTIESRSNDDQRWIVRFTLSDAPETYYLYDRATRKAAPLFVGTPQLEGLKLSKLYPVVIKSRDGLDLVSYISIPHEMDKQGNGRPSAPLPTVMIVHGGPSDERAQYGFYPLVQWLTNRGYAVLIVNFRGSPGFGKAFMNAQNLEWGGKMNDDLVDQAQWIVDNAIAQKDKIAILGGSYGGYATLAAMTFTPDVFACGVDVVGPANLETFMATIPPYWSLDNLARRVGDPRTAEGRELLRKRSPINRAAKVTKPLLIGQGAIDVRVPQAESDRMVDALKKNGVEVTYLLYPDEGHGFLRPENSMSFFAVAEVFLGRCLAGQYQPIDASLHGSSIQVPSGAQYIPGLEPALKSIGKAPVLP